MTDQDHSVDLTSPEPPQRAVDAGAAPEADLALTPDGPADEDGPSRAGSSAARRRRRGSRGGRGRRRPGGADGADGLDELDGGDGRRDVERRRRRDEAEPARRRAAARRADVAAERRSRGPAGASTPTRGRWAPGSPTAEARRRRRRPSPEGHGRRAARGAAGPAHRGAHPGRRGGGSGPRAQAPDRRQPSRSGAGRAAPRPLGQGRAHQPRASRQPGAPGATSAAARPAEPRAPRPRPTSPGRWRSTRTCSSGGGVASATAARSVATSCASTSGPSWSRSPCSRVAT